MGKDSKIEWTDASWNPWMGCRKVSPGCKFCYAERDMTRYGKDFSSVTRAKDATFRAPLKWKEPRRIFTCSWSDWFIEEADAWRDEAWEIIRQTPQHTYLILTKRPQRIIQDGACRLPWKPGEKPWPHVWLGVSIEDWSLKMLDRLTSLLCAPAGLHFISYEPALGAIEWNSALTTFVLADGAVISSPIRWVIIGGESGPKAREFKIEWAYEALARCREHALPCFIKQMGSNATSHGERVPFSDPKGADMSEWPEALRVRQFPDSPQRYRDTKEGTHADC